MMIRVIAWLIVILLALAALAEPAAAEPARPTLRARVTISGPIVRIGDLVANAGAVADVPIFRAPDPGTRGAVATERVLEAIRPHQLVDIDTGGLTDVIVTRASRAITPKEISDRIAQALAGQYGLGDARNIAVSFDHAVRTLHVEVGATGELEVAALAYDARTARFDVTFDLPSSALLHLWPPRYTGTAVATVDAVVIAHAIARGEVIKTSDVAIERRAKTEEPGLSDMALAVGMAARHDLRAGQVLHAADLMKPMIVQRNDAVTIVYQVPGLTLTLRGQAQEAGAFGDRIAVLNPQSKHVVQGVICGRDRVSVQAMTARFVENSAPPAVPRSSFNEPESERRLSSIE